MYELRAGKTHVFPHIVCVLRHWSVSVYLFQYLSAWVCISLYSMWYFTHFTNGLEHLMHLSFLYMSEWHNYLHIANTAHAKKCIFGRHSYPKQQQYWLYTCLYFFNLAHCENWHLATLAFKTPCSTKGDTPDLQMHTPRVFITALQLYPAVFFSECK